jgi:hypothetical protein
MIACALAAQQSLGGVRCGGSGSTRCVCTSVHPHHAARVFAYIIGPAAAGSPTMVVCDAAPTIASVMHVMRCGGSCKCTVYDKLKPMQLHLCLFVT